MTAIQSEIACNPHSGVGAYFDRKADTFDLLYSEDKQGAVMRWLNRNFRSDIAERFLATLDCAAEVQADSVLDVGCGPGRYIAALADLGVHRLVGIDVSVAMLHLARSLTLPYRDANMEFVLADFDRWQSDETFDMVVAMGLFDYIADPIATLRKMRAHVKKCVIASFPSRHWFRTPFRKWRYKIRNCPVYFYDRESVEALAWEAGFTAVDVVKVPGAGMDYVARFYTTGVPSVLVERLEVRAQEDESVSSRVA